MAMPLARPWAWRAQAGRLRDDEEVGNRLLLQERHVPCQGVEKRVSGQAAPDGQRSIFILSPGDRDMLTELVVREKVGELFSKIDVNNCI